MSDTKYVFIVEWFDTAASLIRTYYLTYFTQDKTIEMVHIYNHCLRRQIFIRLKTVRFEEQEDIFEEVRVQNGRD